MKMLNYDGKYLIMQNLRLVERTTPEHYTNSQYKILCNLIRQKKVTKQFFDFLLLELYGLSDWKQLDYWQMYELIHVLTYWKWK